MRVGSERFSEQEFHKDTETGSGTLSLSSGPQSSCPLGCCHLPRSSELLLLGADFGVELRSSSLTGLQAWCSWLKNLMGWQPWGSREGLRAPGP